MIGQPGAERTCGRRGQSGYRVDVGCGGGSSCVAEIAAWRHDPEPGMQGATLHLRADEVNQLVADLRAAQYGDRTALPASGLKVMVQGETAFTRNADGTVTVSVAGRSETMSGEQWAFLVRVF